MKYRRALIQVTRYTICALLFIYLFEKMDGPDLRKALAAALTRWPDLLIGTAFSFCGLFAGVIRWHRLLHGYTIPLPFKKVFKMLFIGQFFNAFMPGSCGGDVVRAFYVCPANPRKGIEPKLQLNGYRRPTDRVADTHALVLSSYRLATEIFPQSPPDQNSRITDICYS